MQLTNIAGESQDAQHKDEIEVVTWRWAVHQQSSMHAGSGGGAGKATIEDLSFEHYIDRTSPALTQHCLLGKHIPEAVLVMRKSGGHPLEYLKITMEDVLITAVSPVQSQGMRFPREQVSLAFARVRQDYVVQNAQGGSQGAVSMGYDIKANQVI